MDQTPIAERLSGLPAKPGVYLLKDEAGQIMYVGKAKSLRNRVRSYLHASADQPAKIQRLVERLADLDFIVTDSEVEALILECNLIKKHRPKYNVTLRDDKSYPYIKVSLQEDYPRVTFTRQMRKDEGRYFGPYTSARSVRQTLEVLRRLFPYVTCRREITGRDKRACLYYHINRCLGPCIGAVSKGEYRAMIRQVCLFLDGKEDQVVRALQRDMEVAVEGLEYERAATIRDRIRAIERVSERQKIVSRALSDQDVIALAREDGEACAQVFFIRQGKLLGREYFLLQGVEEEGTPGVMTSFLKQFYDRAAYVPKEVLLDGEVEEADIIQAWLGQKRGAKVSLRIPRRGMKRRLVEMVAQNATETLAHLRQSWLADAQKRLTALSELKEHLKLENLPKRIECYDISNIQGQAATGSMVVFVEGKPRVSAYRRFRIRAVEGADDYAMLREVLRRRFQRAKMEEAAASWRELPDLVMVDGGKGQLSAAIEAMGETGVGQIPAMALAKEREEIFIPRRRAAIILPKNSQSLYLVQRIRDEAHRFAIDYHRRLHRKRSLGSQLEEIPGIGHKRRKALLGRFGSLEAIRQAPLEELAATESMNLWAAERVREYL